MLQDETAQDLEVHNLLSCRFAGHASLSHLAGSLLQDSAWASLSVAEASLQGSCGKTGELRTFPMAAAPNPGAHLQLAAADPEDPTCAKLSVSGKLEPVEEDALQEAESLLFSRHEAMRSWPTGHQFAV